MIEKKSSAQDWQELNVIDLILMDHRFIKECIEILKDENADKRKKFLISRNFLEALKLHSLAEKKAIYPHLESNEVLHFNILEAQIEHGIVDKKVRSIKTKLTNAKVLKDEVEAELKVLAELVEHHLIEEETQILPKMKSSVSEKKLNDMGRSFMKLRKFSHKDLIDYPQLEDELIQWKDSVQKVSSQLLRKMDRYVENLKH